MYIIDCDICQDLIPLVQDNIASKSSKMAVLSHAEKCEKCSRLLDYQTISIEINEKTIMKKIKRKAYMFFLLLILIGVALSAAVYKSGESSAITLLFMPIIGAISYACYKRLWFAVPCGIAVFTSFVHFLYAVFDNVLSNAISNIPIAVAVGLLYAAFSAIGVIIFKLLCFVFRKDDNNEN